ncbi:glycerophosphodiester phosphodiesterase family protein [Sphingomonas sp. RB56-2]|uniref:Glycerophosphodiester phosphodiesterase family protein n=1 Tax=Sphingomonas brevis TaxID=2908206 RepID=A0ABT0S580_9SPHN|nr:glycerophosphodiester phosphodiesterase family protein [Sphingomonas brevis]MCL6739554.1 glycerophosphodiester phosphodiesterase family protein [Sphingomonas brevis]
MRLAALLLANLAGPAPAAPPPAQPVTIVAHRGLAEGLPENTLAAFRQSIDRGIKVIELDVRVTRDRQLVILHDATLDRTTDCSGPLSSFTLVRLKACDAGWPTHQGERVPTLAEAIALVEHGPARLLLDIKPATPLDAVLAEVRELHAERKVILGLRSASEISQARTALPGVMILGFMPKVDDAPAFAKAGVDIIRLWSDWVGADPALVARTQRLGTDAWVMIGRRLPANAAEWSALHSRMLATYPQGLITNRPDLIVAR